MSLLYVGGHVDSGMLNSTIGDLMVQDRLCPSLTWQYAHRDNECDSHACHACDCLGPYRMGYSNVLGKSVGFHQFTSVSLSFLSIELIFTYYPHLASGSRPVGR